jgi:PAS domain S-box-containing protein
MTGSSSPAPPEPEGIAHSVTDSFTAHVSVLDETGTIVATNRAWRTFATANPPLAGNVCEGANYLTVCDLATGAYAEEAATMGAGIRAVREGTQNEFLLEYPCHSPWEKRWFNARVTRFLDNGALRIVVTHENITTRKQAEEAQRELIKELASERVRLETLLRTIPDLVWLKSVDGVFFWCNPPFETLMGASEEYIIGRTDYDFLDKELADYVRENDHKAIATGGPCVNEEWLTFASDGHRALFETIKTPMLDGEGQILGVLGMARDITERHKAAEIQRALTQELSAKEAFLRTLLQTIPDMIWLKDMNGVYLFCNSKVEDFLGVKEVDIIGKRDHDVLDQEVADAFVEVDRKVMAADGPNVEERWITFASDGHLALCEAIQTPMRDADGHVLGVLGIAHDITERHLAEIKLRLALADLARSNEELEQFAYVASHDLQEPLRMVSSYTQLLAKRYKGRLDTDADEFIGFAVDGANRMQVLITDLLALSRVGTRGKKLELSDCESALGQALINLRGTLEASGAVVTHDPLPVLRMDKSQIVQLFQNLIGNAIKFHGEELPRVHVAAEQTGNEWRFSIRDNGIGFDPQYTERIFSIFQRLHTREEYPGTGIGLAICKKVVERHGGRIWAETQPGKGSTFHFTIASGESQP